MYEIVVIKDKVYRYATTWRNLRFTAKHVGDIHKKQMVNVYYNNQPFCTIFTYANI